MDPDIERTPPPPATIVYFPQNDLNLPAAEDFFHRPGGPPDLYAAYCHIAKPSDVTLQHLAALNITVQDDVSPEDLMPASSDGLQHLPPRCWGAGGVLAPPRRQSSSAYEIYAHNTYPLLSNGTKAPDLETFQKFASELICDTDAGLRVIGKQKPKPGQKLPHFNTYRKFWTHLETLSSYWWTAEDVYVEVDSNAAHGKGLMSKLGRRASVDAGKGHKTLRYRGRRLHSGAKMPDPFRNDCIRAFVEPLVHAFGCGMASPRRLPQLQIKSLLIPVTQTAVIWRVPQDKAQAKRGVLEGPVIGIQCRSETAFMRDPIVALLDTAREMAGVILVGQERAREGKQDVSPGAGQWYTTKPRWGGGPGGEFGEFEGNKELGSHSHGRKPVVSTKYRPSEEDIWKELKPAPGPFEAHMTYLAVGKERMSEVDSVSWTENSAWIITLIGFTRHS